MMIARHARIRFTQNLPTTTHTAIRNFQSSIPQLFPIQTVEVLSVNSRLERIVAPVGSLVAAGDIVAIVSNDDDTTTQIRSPSAGQIEGFAVDLYETVGEALFQLNTDVSVPNDLADFLQHVAVNRGQIDNKFFQKYLQLKDQNRIWSLAVQLGEQFAVQALQLLERVLALQTEPSERIRTLIYTSQLLRRMGDLDQAVLQAQMALDLDPNHVPALRHWSDLALETGDSAGALQAQEQIIQQDSNNSRALIQVAFIQIQMGQIQPAIERLEQALARTDESSMQIQCHDLLAEAYYHIHPQEPKILDHLAQSLQLVQGLNNPQRTARAHVRLGLAFVDRNEFEAALEQLEAAQKIKPDDDEVVSALGFCHCQRLKQQRQENGETPSNATAVDYCQQAVNLLKEHGPPAKLVGAWNSLGTAYFLGDDLDQALESHNAALIAVDNPTSVPEQMALVETHFQMGNVYRTLNRLEECLQSNQNGKDLLSEVLGPDHLDVALARNNIGGLLLALGRAAQALQEYGDVCRIFEEQLGKHAHTAAAHFNAGVCLQKLGDTETAMEHYEAAKGMWRDNPSQVAVANKAIESCRA